ncbi:ASCH/PUA domain-containing protein [Paenibacillus sp. Marseille-Q9583]
MIHELKLVQPFYNAVEERRKTFEVRKNDRDFNVGDYLNLAEYDPEAQRHTGQGISRKITYILDDPTYVKEGYVILGIA